MAGIDWAQMAGNLFANVSEGAPRRLVDQLGQWVGLLSKNAATKWAPSFLGEVYQCGFCEGDALTRCSVCGVDVCLAHSAVRHTAEAVCDECIQIAVDARKQPKRRRKSRKPPERPPQKADDVVEAYAVLGLAVGADLDIVEAVFRKKAGTCHPDKGGSEAEFSRITAAYHLLKTHLQRAA